MFVGSEALGTNLLSTLRVLVMKRPLLSIVHAIVTPAIPITKRHFARRLHSKQLSSLPLPLPPTFHSYYAGRLHAGVCCNTGSHVPQECCL